ncbi:MAG: maleylpyruvate isomerase N-terminal domain-containing protein [Actinoplanes sp.]
MDYRRTFRTAAVSFVDLVSRLPADRWDEPGLGDWTLRELVGHTASSALRQIPTVLTAPAEVPAVRSAAPTDAPAERPAAPSITSPEGYFAYARKVPADLYATAQQASTRDARETARILGDDPATTVGELAARATQALAAATDDDVVATPAGAMRVRDWIPTRTFELVVHGLDVAAAAGVTAGFTDEAVAESAQLAARLAVAVGDGPAVLQALTGRAQLPESFSVM